MQIKKENIKDISENELDYTIWRYLTFSKFISLLTYGSLWFPKLNILQDQFEGNLPTPARESLEASHQKWKTKFPPNLHNQFDEMAKRNVEDGRELTVVNCWFLDESESPEMWDDYVQNNEGVAIRSTVRKLATHVFTEPQFSSIGKVRYVDFASHDMTIYHASQASERAFLKRDCLKHEQEVRIVTLNFKTPACVDMNGIPYTQEQIAGKNMNNFENAGLYIRVNLEKLIDSIVIAPQAPGWFELLIKRIMGLSQLNIEIKRSELEPQNE
ncbi:MAG: DUF2971 domain-containing protein [Candidatus Scalindua sp.]